MNASGNQSGSVALGVDVGGTLTRGAAVDREGQVVDRLERPTDTTAGTKGIISVVEELVCRNPGVAAIGVGAAGFINAATGSVTFSPNLQYDDPQIAEAVRNRTGIPVIVDNDANVAALGEAKFGSAQGSDFVAFLTLGTGIGSGFIDRGRLVRGFTGAGAEIGHMVIDVNGPPCPCGLKGCFEQMASGTAIGRMGREAVVEDPESSILAFAGSVEAITGKHVAQAARRVRREPRAMCSAKRAALSASVCQTWSTSSIPR